MGHPTEPVSGPGECTVRDYGRAVPADPDPTSILPALPPLPEDWRRALCVVAHPDDLEYGASSAVARWTDQGKQVTYLLATRGEAGIDSIPPHEAGRLREAEERAGAAEVGVEVVEFLGLTDGVVEAGLPLRREIARAIRRHKPEVVVSNNFHLTWGGPSFNMADHRVVGLAALDASRDAGNRWIFPELVDDGFDPWPGVRLVCFGGSPEPTHGVDVTGYVARRGGVVAGARGLPGQPGGCGLRSGRLPDGPGRRRRAPVGRGPGHAVRGVRALATSRCRAALRRRTDRWRRRRAGACARR